MLNGFIYIKFFKNSMLPNFLGGFFRLKKKNKNWSEKFCEFMRIWVEKFKFVTVFLVSYKLFFFWFLRSFYGNQMLSTILGFL